MILPEHPDAHKYQGLKGLRAIGYWKNDHHHDLPDPDDYIDAGWDKGERDRCASYLESGEPVMHWRGSAQCRICGTKGNGSRCLTDGVYVWPEGLPHYLKEHELRLPEVFVLHALGMGKQADLSPSLGKPGGPCQVVRRIEDEIRSPRLKDQLTDKVEDGKSLSNPEAAKVYDLETERAKGLVTKMLIGPHAQYRMDLRKVTVKDLQRAFSDWTKEVHALRKKGDPKYDALREMLNSGDPIRYTSPQNLTVVFSGRQKGTVQIVSTWWQGVADPPPPGSCEVRSAYNYDRRPL